MLPVSDLPPQQQERAVCSIVAAVKYEIPANILLATAEKEGGKPGRERIFIVGFREENDFDLNALVFPDHTNGPTLSSILHSEDGSEEPDGHFIGLGGKVDARYTLSDHLWGYLQAYAEKHREKGNGFGFGLFSGCDVARTLSARYHKDGSEILIRQKRKNPRRLTPRECTRLMGFEKSREQKFRIPVSDTQAYRQFGNSVVVPVVTAIAEQVTKALGLSSMTMSKEVVSHAADAVEPYSKANPKGSRKRALAEV